MQTTKAKKNIYKAVLKDILECLEEGTEPWKGVFCQHQSIRNRHKYRGINRLICNTRARKEKFSSVYWGTKKMILDMDGRILKDQFKNCTNILFMKPLAYLDGVLLKGDYELSDQELLRIARRWLLKYYKIWNFDQCCGIKEPERTNTSELDDYTITDNFIKKYTEMPILINDIAGSPQYDIINDTISMPPKRYFNENNYCPTLFHEIIHSTGNKKRLARFDNDTKHKVYAKEELIAELGAAFLSSELNILPENNHNSSASYIDGWRKVISEDVSIIILAAQEAEKAIDYIKDNCNPNIS